MIYSGWDDAYTHRAFGTYPYYNYYCTRTHFPTTLFLGSTLPYRTTYFRGDTFTPATHTYLSLTRALSRNNSEQYPQNTIGRGRFSTVTLMDLPWRDPARDLPVYLRAWRNHDS